MAITSALVLLAVIWFMTLFIVLPFASRTQAEDGEIVPGTHGSAPANFDPARTARIVTYWTVPIWIVMCTVILMGWITVDDFDLFKRFGPGPLPIGGTDG